MSLRPSSLRPLSLGPSWLLAFVVSILPLMPATHAAAESAQGTSKALQPIDAGPSRVFVSCASILADAQPAGVSWQPGIARSRGDEDLYATVAPSVVIVRTDAGHGTGFVVNAKRQLVLTNYHVIQSGTAFDAERQASIATVNLGALNADGYMQLNEASVPALVVGVDRVRDLALLQLQSLPPGIDRLVQIPLGQNATPGNSCAIIGHPSSGFPWTFRPGSISSAGESPRHLVNFLLPLLASSGSQRQEMEAELDAAHSVNILLSSCEANPGDSGGPLVDKNGQLIGVTFAIPGDAAEQKFTYHISLGEVRAFLEAADEKPVLLVPGAWEIGSMVVFVEPYVLMASTRYGRQLLFDLDADTPAELLETANLQELIGNQRFDIEAALHFSANRRLAFYDTDNSGGIDTILDDFDEDMTADRRFVSDAKGNWSVAVDIDVEHIDATLLQKPELRDAFAAAWERLQQKQQQAER